MWSDSIYLVERAHLARLLAWGIGSALAGTALVLLLLVMRRQLPLLRGFGIATACVGILNVALALNGLRRLDFRDLAAFTHFDRMLWMNVGLDFGYLATGATLALCGWMLGRSQAAIGTGTALLAQGVALLLLHANTLSSISSLAVGSGGP